MIDDQLFGKTRAGILREVYLNPGRRISFNELVRRVGTGDGAVSRELKNLLATGLVIEEREGNHRFLRAGQDSPLFKEARAFISKASGPTHIIRRALADLESQIAVAFIFGSVAKGRERADSDLDLFFIGSAGYSVVTERLRSLEKRLGRRVQTLHFNADSQVDRASLQKPSMRSILAGPKRFVIGTDGDLERVLGWGSKAIGQPSQS
jgi:predicted nucleotidyltransferase